MKYIIATSWLAAYDCMSACLSFFSICNFVYAIQEKTEKDCVFISLIFNHTVLRVHVPVVTLQVAYSALLGDILVKFCLYASVGRFFCIQPSLQRPVCSRGTCCNVLFV